MTDGNRRLSGDGFFAKTRVQSLKDVRPKILAASLARRRAFVV
jgi:hypothetical protein